LEVKGWLKYTGAVLYRLRVSLEQMLYHYWVQKVSNLRHVQGYTLIFQLVDRVSKWLLK